MDFFKDSLLKLSESDKRRLIAELTTTLLNDESNKQNDLDFQRLLADKSPEKNSPSPKKKQKTLDGWLIKRNDSSKQPVDRLTSKQAAKSNINNVTESAKNSEETNTEDLTPQNLENCNDNSIHPSTSRFAGKSSSNSENSLTVSDKGEANNLFSESCPSRSKRKVSLTSPSSECERTPKRAKSTCDKEDDLHINNEKGSRRDESNDPDCISESEDINHKSSAENENLISKKNKYNLRTKTKISNLVQIGEASNKAKIENNQADKVINNVNHSSKSTASKLKSEAFSKLNQICKEMSIDVSEILKNKNVESVLKDPTILSKDAIVFIGALTLNTGKTSPIVHLAKSKKKLSELLVSKQKKQFST